MVEKALAVSKFGIEMSRQNRSQSQLVWTFDWLRPRLMLRFNVKIWSSDLILVKKESRVSRFGIDMSRQNGSWSELVLTQKF